MASFLEEMQTTGHATILNQTSRNLRSLLLEHGMTEALVDELATAAVRTNYGQGSEFHLDIEQDLFKGIQPQTLNLVVLYFVEYSTNLRCRMTFTGSSVQSQLPEHKTDCGKLENDLIPFEVENSADIRP